MNSNWWAYFAERTTESQETGCWEWIGAKARGYGVGGFGGGRHGKTQLAHRVAYTKLVGPIPEGLLVRHSCHNPPCCNPAHLVVGTHADNTDDRRAAGRTTNYGKSKSRLLEKITPGKVLAP